MTEEDDRRLEQDVCVHIFGASTGMLGVCVTVIGIIKVVTTIEKIDTLADDLLAVAALLFLVSGFLSYLAIRRRSAKRKHALERVADSMFMIGMCVVTAVCGIIAWAVV